MRELTWYCLDGIVFVFKRGYNVNQERNRNREKKKPSMGKSQASKMSLTVALSTRKKEQRKAWSREGLDCIYLFSFWFFFLFFFEGLSRAYNPSSFSNVERVSEGERERERERVINPKKIINS